MPITLDTLSWKLDLTLQLLGQVLNNQLHEEKREKKIMADLSALTAEVANNTSVEESVVALINNLAAQVAANATDPAALAALVTQLQSNDAALAAAVTAN